MDTRLTAILTVTVTGPLIFKSSSLSHRFFRSFLARINCPTQLNHSQELDLGLSRPAGPKESQENQYS